MNSRDYSIAALLAAVLIAFTPFARAENIIRQTQMLSGQQYDQVTDDDTGSSLSFLPIAQGGAKYDLFARGTAWDNNLYYLDTKIVGFYMPEATITISTGDWVHQWFNPNLAPRTRADQPFTVTITMSGLIDLPQAPKATRESLFTRIGQNYNDSYVPGVNAEYTLDSYSITQNSTQTFSNIFTALTPMAPTKAMGIETWTISTIADQKIPSAGILDEAALVVWPVSQATIEGVSSGEEIRDDLPDIVFRYRDLYPLSLTYVQIYAGPPSLGTVGQTVSSTVRWHNTNVPQNEIIAIENWEDLVPIDGAYTLEVLSITPFNNWQPERLSFVSFDINRRVNVNAQAVTSEK